MNALLDDLRDAPDAIPLSLVACDSCGHGQLGVFADPEVLFRDYLYVSNTSRTLMEHFRNLAAAISGVSSADGTVLEIASNDGSFLDALVKHGIHALGVEPAESLAAASRARGHQVMSEFWPDAGDGLIPESVSLIVGQNVLAHTPDPLHFLEGCRRVLQRDGLAVFQTSQADMVANGEFDTVYHEHYSFFNEASARRLGARAGFELLETQYVAIHGTSAVYVFGTATAKVRASEFIDRLGTSESVLRAPKPTIQQAALRTQPRTLNDWIGFASQARGCMSEARKICDELGSTGSRRVVAVGAAAKAITFLRAAGIAPDVILDESPFKIGKWAPGLAPRIEDLRTFEPRPTDFFLMTAWNFAPELASKMIEAGASPKSATLVYFPHIRLSGLESFTTA